MNAKAKVQTILILALLFPVIHPTEGLAQEINPSSETVILADKVQIPVEVDGKEVGKTSLPAGTKVTVLSRDGARVSIKLGNLGPVWVEESQLSGLSDKKPQQPSTPVKSDPAIDLQKLTRLVSDKKWPQVAAACEAIAQADEKFAGLAALAEQLKSALQAQASAVQQQKKAETEAQRLRRNADVVGQPSRLNPSDNSPMERAQKLRDEADSVIEEAKTAFDASEAQIAQAGMQISSEVSGMIAQPKRPSLGTDDGPSTPTEMPSLAVTTSESARRQSIQHSISPNTNEDGSAVRSSLEFRRGPNIRGLQLGMTLDEFQHALAKINPKLEQTEGKIDKDTSLLEDQVFGRLLAKSTQTQNYRFFDPELKGPYPPAVIAVDVLIPSQIVISIEWNFVRLPEYSGLWRRGEAYFASFTEFCEALASAYGIPNLRAVDGDPNHLAHRSKGGYAIQIKDSLGMLLGATCREQEATTNQGRLLDQEFVASEDSPTSATQAKTLPDDKFGKLWENRLAGRLSVKNYELSKNARLKAFASGATPQIGMDYQTCVERFSVTDFKNNTEQRDASYSEWVVTLDEGWTRALFRVGDILADILFSPEQKAEVISLDHIEGWRVFVLSEESLELLCRGIAPGYEWSFDVSSRRTKSNELRWEGMGAHVQAEDVLIAATEKALVATTSRAHDFVHKYRDALDRGKQPNSD